MISDNNDSLISTITSVLDPIENLQNFNEDGLRSAAILLPLIKVEDKWHILYIHRAENGDFHSGEVAFPGGSREKNDLTLTETALRETYEELGIPSKEITVLGFLPPMTTISKFYVTPIVGKINWPTKIEINSSEVKHYFFVPIEWLNNSVNWKEHEIEIPGRGKIKTIDYKLFQSEHLWGITARITRILLDRINNKIAVA